MAQRPLEGIRVLDLSRLLPGPFCSMLLADYGAEVIKIEDPGIGDYLRHVPPLVDGTSAYFRGVNRNKKSMTLNLREPEGVEVFKRLVPGADVVLEGFRPGIVQRLGIDYPVLQALNPRLIYASLSGFGQTGPWRDRSGHDLNYLALSGALATFAAAPGADPVLPGVQVADMAGAMYGAFAIATALAGRERTGEGAYLDVAMVDSILSWLPFHAARTFATGQAPSPGDTELTGAIARYGCYRTSDDRYMALGAFEEKFWRTFCTAANHPEWLHEPSQDALRSELQGFFAARSQAKWMAWSEQHDVCLEPVLTMSEAFEHPQIQARHMVHADQHQLGAAVPYADAGPRTPPPDLGAHTDAILAELGLSATECAALRDRGLV